MHQKARIGIGLALDFAVQVHHAHAAVTRYHVGVQSCCRARRDANAVNAWPASAQHLVASYKVERDAARGPDKVRTICCCRIDIDDGKRTADGIADQKSLAVFVGRQRCWIGRRSHGAKGWDAIDVGHQRTGIAAAVCRALQSRQIAGS